MKVVVLLRAAAPPCWSPDEWSITAPVLPIAQNILPSNPGDAFLGKDAT